MQVNSSTNAPQTSQKSSTSTTTQASSTSVNYDSFLQLLVTELKNQDPTKPMDPTQTVTQLATFSQVEQAVQTNDLLKALSTTSSLSQAASLVGKTITTADGKSGVVKSVQISASGLTARLDNNSTVPLSSGVTIS